MTDYVDKLAGLATGTDPDAAAQARADLEGLATGRLEERDRGERAAALRALAELDGPDDAARPDPESEAPLAELARRRQAELVRTIAGPMTAADLRDAAIALAAIGSALEDLERADGRVWIHGRELERWARDLGQLLELLGEPAEDAVSGDLARAYWSVAEGVLGELAEEVPAEVRVTLPRTSSIDRGRPEPGGGYLGEVAQLRRELERTAERLARAQNERDVARDERDTAERRLAEYQAEVRDTARERDR